MDPVTLSLWSSTHGERLIVSLSGIILTFNALEFERASQQSADWMTGEQMTENNTYTCLGQVYVAPQLNPLRLQLTRLHLSQYREQHERQIDTNETSYEAIMIQW